MSSFVTHRCAAMNGAPPRPSLSAATRPQRSALVCYARVQLTWRVRKARSDPSLPVPRLDYAARMTQAQQDPSSCPLLMLAPMESLGDWRFRQSLASTVGGFDEACTEFIRVPTRTDHPGPSVRGVVAQYDARELGSFPIGAQIMSSNPQLLGMAAELLVGMEAPRVDLNCGCPANTVTGHGAGSSLLRTPELLHDCVRSMVQAAAGRRPISVKLRSGFQDTSRFEENLLAAQEAGASFVTIHPRTKVQTYQGRADWSLIARARQLLRIPVVANGDIVSVATARQLLQQTGCGAVMIGRGVVADPLLFHRIRASYQQPELPWEWDEPEVVQSFLRGYAASCLKPKAVQGEGVAAAAAGLPAALEQGSGRAAEDESSGEAGSCSGGGMLDGNLAISRPAFFGRMKKIMRYLFSSEPALAQASEALFRTQPGSMTAEELVDLLCMELKQHWGPRGPSQRLLFNHMEKTLQVVESSPVVAAAVAG